MMKRSLSILMVTLICCSLLLCACSGSDAGNTSTNSDEKTSEVEETEKTEDPVAELGTTAEYDNCTMEILGGTFDQDTLKVQVKFTNNGADPIYGLSAFGCKAYQDNRGCDDLTDINDGGPGAELTREVMKGASTEGEYRFAVPGEGDIEVVIVSPTADAEPLAHMFFEKPEASAEASDADNEEPTVNSAVEYIQGLLPKGIEVINRWVLDEKNVVVGYRNNSGKDVDFCSTYYYADGNGDFFGTSFHELPCFRSGEEYYEHYGIDEPFEMFAIEFEVNDVHANIKTLYDSMDASYTINEDKTVSYYVAESTGKGMNCSIYITYLDANDEVVGYDHVDVAGETPFEDYFDTPLFDYDHVVMNVLEFH